MKMHYKPGFDIVKFCIIYTIQLNKTHSQCKRVIIYTFDSEILNKILNKSEYFYPIGFVLINKIIQNVQNLINIIVVIERLENIE